MNIPVLDGQYVQEHLEMRDCVNVMEATLRQEASGGCKQYLRTAVPLPNGNILGLMPAWFDTYFGVKALSVYPGNGSLGLPSHQGQILLFSSQSGEPIANVDADTVTQIRTGAVSAAASKALANADSTTLAILGCGAQGLSHARAILTQFPLKKIALWDRTPAKAGRLAAALPADVSVSVCSTVQEAVADADIICTVTASKEPILKYEWVKPGAHINAVGACSPKARELDGALVAASSFYGDSIESVLHESGDYLIPLEEGLIGADHLKGTVGQVLTKAVPGRQSRDEITVFESLGMAVEDMAAAKHVYDLWRSSSK